MHKPFVRLPALDKPILLPDELGRAAFVTAMQTISVLVFPSAEYYSAARQWINEREAVDNPTLLHEGLHNRSHSCRARAQMDMLVIKVTDILGENALFTQLLYADYVALLTRAAGLAISMGYMQQRDSKLITDSNPEVPISHSSTFVDLSSAYVDLMNHYSSCINRTIAILDALPTLLPCIDTMIAKYLGALIGHLLIEYKIAIYRDDPGADIGDHEDYMLTLPKVFAKRDLANSIVTSEKMAPLQHLFERVGKPGFFGPHSLVMFHRMVVLLGACVGDFDSARNSIAVLHQYDPNRTPEMARYMLELISSVEPPA